MFERNAQIVSNDQVSGLFYRLKLFAPDIAEQVQPGQFAHIRISRLKEALFRRPFSIFQSEGDTFSILYKVVGKGTAVLSQMRPDDELNVIAPLGHGFSIPERGQEIPLLVAGGYGMAALYLLAQRSKQKGIVFVGGKSSGDILCDEEFRALGWEVRVTTEDGSRGDKGLVIQPLRAELERGTSGKKVFACGPKPMLKSVAQITSAFNVPAEISMDEHMCCGVGVCLTCVIPIRTAEGWVYHRTCTEGPVFNAQQIIWDNTL